MTWPEFPAITDPLVIQRFHERAITDEAGCWGWRGTFSEDRPVLSIKGRNVRAARIAYAITYGPIPAGMCACHRCDNPGCIRPDHIFVDTIADNNADMVAKGRMADLSHLHQRGADANHVRPLAEVTAVREVYATSGLTVAEVGRRFGIHPDVVSRYLRGRGGAYGLPAIPIDRTRQFRVTS